ncbi:hypothetical protein [Aquipuribacter hungaricus]|uniref:YecA family protein n=1 Tax=Aquipuribacter hungaricus TaxID=545624 RepID=A0ABV7WH65_9MICO
MGSQVLDDRGGVAVSQLYNFFGGSLDELRRAVEADDEPGTPEALDRAVEASWTLVHPVVANLLDWHEQDALLEQAALLPGRAGELVARLFTSPPLGIEPYDSGFPGELGAGELAELRAVLEAVCSTSARRPGQDPGSWDIPLDECEDPLEGPARLLLGLRPVTPAKDLVLLL